MYFEIGHDCLLHVIRSLQLIIIVMISMVARYACYRSVGFEVYTVVKIIVLAFWVMTPCSLVAEVKPVLQFSLPAPCMLVTKDTRICRTLLIYIRFESLSGYRLSFLNSIWCSSGILGKCGIRPLPSTSIPVHYSLSFSQRSFYSFYLQRS